MNFIIHPGKVLHGLVPTQSLTWYNTEFFKAVLKSKSQTLVNYYRCKSKPKILYTLSSQANNHSVEFDYADNLKTVLRLSYFESDLCSSTAAVLKKLIQVQTVCFENNKEMLLAAQYVVSYLDTPHQRFNKQSITNIPNPELYYYCINDLKQVGNRSTTVYHIRTSSNCLDSIVLAKDQLLGVPNIADCVVVKNGVHRCIPRVDFYKHYCPIV